MSERKLEINGSEEQQMIEGPKLEILLKSSRIGFVLTYQRAFYRWHFSFILASMMLANDVLLP